MPTTRSRMAQERTHTEGSSQLGPITEEANPFASISQAFAPYSESISAISGSHRRPSAFGPATVRAPAVTGVSPEPVFGSTVSGEYVYQTMLTQSGEELTVLTPRTRRTNTTVTNLPPTVLFPETRHPTTPICSVHSDHADDDLYEDRTWDIRSGHNTPSGPPPGGNTPDEPGDGDGPPDPPGLPGGGLNPPNPGSSHPGNDDDDTFNQFRNTMSSFQSTLAGLGQIISTATQLKPDNSKRNKVKDPEVFDGSDPQKLKTFFVDLALIFLEKPDYFTNQRKIHYMLSYLPKSSTIFFLCIRCLDVVDYLIGLSEAMVGVCYYGKQKFLCTPQTICSARQSHSLVHPRNQYATVRLTRNSLQVVYSMRGSSRTNGQNVTNGTELLNDQQNGNGIDEDTNNLDQVCGVVLSKQRILIASAPAPRSGSSASATAAQNERGEFP